MAFEKYVKLPGSERKPMPGAAKTGVPDPKESMHVTVVLRERPAHGKQPSLTELVASGGRVSRDEYAAQYGADPKDVKEVEKFAHAHGLKVGQVNLPARTVALTGSCSAFAKAFQVELATYQYEGRSLPWAHRRGQHSQRTQRRCCRRAWTRQPPQAKAHFRMATNASAAAATSYTALQIAQAYNFPTSVNGKGQTIAIIELGGGYTQSDLDTYFSVAGDFARAIGLGGFRRRRHQPTHGGHQRTRYGGDARH